MVGDEVASAAAADIIVLAVKPQVVNAVAKQMDTDLSGKLILSIAAGVTIATLEDLFGQVAIARTMPNTPALLDADRHAVEQECVDVVFEDQPDHRRRHGGKLLDHLA